MKSRSSVPRGHVCLPRTLAMLGSAAALAGCGMAGDAPADHQATLTRYCLDCHNDNDREAGLTLASLDLGAIAHDPEIWEKVVRKLRTGMMPPGDARELAPELRNEFAGWLEDELDAAAGQTPNPGRTVAFHRLNRNEYRNVIRDLLAVEIDVDELLPSDDASYGFDNIAGVLKISPTLLERYLTVADEISRLAVGRATPFVSIDHFRVPDDRSQEQRLPGMPFGTRGGMSVSYTFPVDGEFEIAADLQRDLNEGLPLYAEEQQLELSIDGERIALFTLPAVPVTPPEAANNNPGAPAISQIGTRLRLSRAEREIRNHIDEGWRVRVPVTAGLHEVTATFIARTAALDETPRLPFLRPYPAGVNIAETRTGAYLRSVEISGPYAVTGPGERSASRARIFTCTPRASDDTECAAQILETLARRAYRRPVTADDVAPLMAFFDEGRQAGGFDGGIQLALKRLLVSPELLFRIERDPADAMPGQVYPVSDLELASRLSFFLWSSLPDDALLDAAVSGQLGDLRVLEAQVRRMLADDKAQAFIENFAGQWLFLRNLDAIVPVQSRFPDFDDTLREALRRETELFFASIVREDRRVFDLLDADYTFVNERVAQHYGIPGIKGPHFRRIEWDADSPRRGLLGHGSILAVTSYPDRTSPVVRGKWILENLLGAPPPAPPPNVPQLTSTDGAGSVISMRERFAAHRANPPCSGCHALMDPLGFALENFNAVGQWRTLGDAGEVIDATGALPNGTSFDGVEGLRGMLLDSELFVMTMTEKLLTYALGRGVEFFDMPTVRAIVRNAAASDQRFSAYVLGVVNSPAFRMRTADGVGENG